MFSLAGFNKYSVLSLAADATWFQPNNAQV